MVSVFRRAECRLCGADKFELVLPILPSAIGDAFVSEEMLGEPQLTYPLDVYMCLECGHLQNLDIVDPKVLFGNYTYRTSVSPGLVKHFGAYAEYIVTNLNLPQDALVVELGSNDGSLLRAFKAHGLRVQGIDAAANIAAQATAEGIPTIGTFFTAEIARSIREAQGPASVVCANNVYAHIDDMADVTRGIHDVMADDGVFIFEVSYVPRMIDNMVFDTIYHEHVSYHTLKPLERFFNRLDMTLFDVVENQSKGGSIRGFAQRLSTGQRPRTGRLNALFVEERERGMHTPAPYRIFFDEIEKRKQATLDILRQAAAQGQTIAAYGASTTTTTLLYHFEMESLVSFIVDDNPVKHGLYSPCAHIPVFPSSILMERKPDIVVILAWIYAEPIITRNRSYLEAGGKFLLPLPEVKLVGADSSGLAASSGFK